MRQPCRLAVTVLAAVVLGGAAVGTGARASALFGAGSSLNLPVTTRDGTVLRADVHYPVDKATGAAAPGPFPVLLQQTPYGKEVVPYGGGISDTDVPYLVGHGYIVVIADVRGTGQSQGSWGLFNPAEGPDGADLVNWAAHLAHSDGTVGLFGVSYMAMNQFLTVGALPASSPVKAIFPILAGNDLYRELLFQGGIPDAEFDVTTGLPVISSLSVLNPVIGPGVDALTGGPAGVRALADSAGRVLPTELQHGSTLGRFGLPTAAGVLGLGGAADVAYDEAWWAPRNMANYLGAVVDHHIPAFLVGGWSDLFPRGELLNYAGLQNLWAGRPQGSPMTAGQPVTPRYQLAMGPWTHLTTDAALVQKFVCGIGGFVWG
jgi:predicted acyl esterase